MTKLEKIVLEDYKLKIHGINWYQLLKSDEIMQDELNLFGYFQYWIRDSQRMKNELEQQKAEQAAAKGRKS